MKNVARAIVGALFTYIIAPVMVGIFTNGVNDTSLAGRLLNAIYPPQVSERITQPVAAPAPPPAAMAKAEPVALQPAPSPTAAAPLKDDAAPLATALTRTPRDAPIAATLAGPLTTSGADLRLSLALTSTSDDLPIFATGGYNLDGWSAVVQPGNVPCDININGLTGLTSSDTARWSQNLGRMTRLPAGAPATVSIGFHCRRDIVAARSVNLALTFGYVLGERARTVRFFANDVPLPGDGQP